MYSMNAAYRSEKLTCLGFFVVVCQVWVGAGCGAQQAGVSDPVSQTQMGQPHEPFQVEESPSSPRFTDERIRSLSYDQIRSLSHGELQEISSEQLSLLRSDQVYALLRSQVLSLRPDQLDGILRGVPEVDLIEPVPARLVPSLNSSFWRRAHEELMEDPTLNFAYVGQYHEYFFYLGRANDGQCVEFVFHGEQLESYGGYGSLF